MDVPDYHLPPSAIAQHPVEPRDAARLLVACGGLTRHRRVSDLPELLADGDLLVVNTSRVLAARLHLRKMTGGAAEVLLLEPVGDDTWMALVRPGRRLPPGTVLAAEDGSAAVEVGARLDEGQRQVRLLRPDVMQIAGSVALPPYIHEPLADPERYQTVYSDRPGSVAAPTAGLHLTHGVLDGVRARGIPVLNVDLAVGLGTFRPVTAGRAEEHVMQVERYQVPVRTWQACQAARRVVAVGTTTVRALETAATTGRLEGRSDLFIRDGYDFAVVDALLTNFHQPRSTLLLLIEAFYGAGWRKLYDEALEAGYRFLSFGDAMLVERDAGRT